METDCGCTILVLLDGVYVVRLSHGWRHELVDGVVDILVFYAMLQSCLESMYDSNLQHNQNKMGITSYSGQC